MNLEIFKKDGTLRTKPPKRYECSKCNLVTSKPATLKTLGLSILVCHNCTGKICERKEYIEWTKRRTGQWSVELEILKLVMGVEMTRDEISTRMMHVDDNLFSSSFSDLCYWGKLNINKDSGSIKYSARSK